MDVHPIVKHNVFKVGGYGQNKATAENKGPKQAIEKAAYNYQNAEDTYLQIMEGISINIFTQVEFAGFTSMTRAVGTALKGDAMLLYNTGALVLSYARPK